MVTPTGRGPRHSPRAPVYPPIGRLNRRSPPLSRLDVGVLLLGLSAGHALRGGRTLPDAGLAHHLVGDLHHQLRAGGQEFLGLFPPLTQLLTLVGEPGARLLHDPELDTEIDDRPLPADALAVHDVELRLAEGRGALVLDHLDPGAVADHLRAVLQALDAADVEPDRGVELERPPAGGRLRRAEHHPDLLPQLVDED